jgi:hypothetical protein
MTIILIGVGVLIYLLCSMGIGYLWNSNKITPAPIVLLFLPALYGLILAFFLPIMMLIGLSVLIGKTKWVDRCITKRK